MENKSTQIIIAIVLLAVGLGAGYYFGMTTTPEPMMPENVDGLDRPDPIPLVNGPVQRYRS